MYHLNEHREMLFAQLQKFRDKFELSKTVEADYFEPGMMEYLDQFYGEYNQLTGEMILRFDAKGTRDAARIDRIEKIRPGDTVLIVRCRSNQLRTNNYMILDADGQELGNVPTALCHALAPLYDADMLVFQKAQVSYVEPLSKRGRYARQAILFVELRLSLKEY